MAFNLNLPDLQTLLLHVGGLAAATALTATGTISPDVGVPIITGLVGLGINTAAASGPTTPVTTVVAAPAPPMITNVTSGATLVAPVSAMPGAQ